MGLDENGGSSTPCRAKGAASDGEVSRTTWMLGSQSYSPQLPATSFTNRVHDEEPAPALGSSCHRLPPHERSIGSL